MMELPVISITPLLWMLPAAPELLWRKTVFETFRYPVSGSLVITMSAVPIYLPPSRGQNLGTGNWKRFISLPEERFSFTGAV
jgi:hypothetical protein